MRTTAGVSRFTVIFLLSGVFCFAQPGHSAARRSQSHNIHLDVAVTGADGVAVPGLSESDFTVLDNGVAQKITSFQPTTGDACPVEVIVVVDTVNPGYSTVAFERQQLDKFFEADGGKLPYPTTLAIFSDNGTQIMRGYTQNGASLVKVFDRQTVALRAIRRSAGPEGAVERIQWSLRLVRQLITAEAGMPGRKIILWVSPGWPLLSGPDIYLSPRQERGLFDEVEDLTSELRQSRITLYAINPLGTSGALETFYQSFLKPVRKPNQVEFGNLSLQVLAVHSGGLVLQSDNDVAALMQKAIGSVRYFYQVSYMPPAGEPDEYHAIQVKIAKPKLKARTTAGYYSGY